MISVIIPVYNVENYLERCVRSVLNQDYDDLEILLVDDGSTDRSGQICDVLSKEDTRIQVIRQQNGGQSSARNRGLDMATGEYLFFLDSDDYIYSGILHDLYSACQRYQADIVCCGYASGRKKYYTTGISEEILMPADATGRMLVCDGLDSNSVAKLYRKTLFDGMRYPLHVYEDVGFMYKIFLRANKIVRLNQCGYYIEKRSGSTTRTMFGDNNLLYVDLAKQQYEEIAIEYPQLSAYAYGFYLNALVTMRERAEDDLKSRGTVQGEKIASLFKEEYNDILHNDKLLLRKKVIAVLLRTRLYRISKGIYRKLRG
jgi:glycosyltransferase involved in cell wall biosynthesis